MIGRDGPMPWPPCSPNITPLDFFLCSYVKRNVFQTPVNGLDDLKSRIRIFQQTYSTEELKYHLDVICATKGAHIEVY
jgi:hypothetical protein